MPRGCCTVVYTFGRTAAQQDSHSWHRTAGYKHRCPIVFHSNPAAALRLQALCCRRSKLLRCWHATPSGGKNQTGISNKI